MEQWTTTAESFGKSGQGMTLLQLPLQQVQERDKRPHHCNARSKGEVVIHCHGLGSLHWLRRQTQRLS